MKKIIVFLLALSLVFSLSACSSGGGSDEQDKQTTTVEQSTEQQTEATTQAKQEETTTEQATTAKNDSKDDDVAKLEGVELLKKIGKEVFKKPENFYVKMEIESAEMPDEKMMMIACEQDGNMRYEVDVMGNHNIMISRVEDGFTYSYNKGEKTGYKVKYEADSENDMIPDFSFDEEELEDDATFEGIVAARYDELDGHKVVYVEMKDFDEDLGEDVTTKLWYSVKHSYPLKMETNKEDGTVIMTMYAVEIEIDKDFSEHFKIPEDVEFATY